MHKKGRRESERKKEQGRKEREKKKKERKKEDTNCVIATKHDNTYAILHVCATYNVATIIHLHVCANNTRPTTSRLFTQHSCYAVIYMYSGLRYMYIHVVYNSLS